MTVKELAADWLKHPWPLTIHADRYGGTYSGGAYLAWSLDFDEIPEEVNGSDPECMSFWRYFKQGVTHQVYLVPVCVGRGSSPVAALEDLRNEIGKL